MFKMDFVSSDFVINKKVVIVPDHSFLVAVVVLPGRARALARDSGVDIQQTFIG